MSDKKFTVAAVAWLLTVAFVTAAQGAVISFSDAVPQQKTNFNKNLSVSLFDPAQGVLTQVKLTFYGGLTAQAGYENIGAGTEYVGIVDYSINQTLSITQGATTYLTMTNNVVDSLDVPVLPAFDGVFDFAGTSGYTDPGVNLLDVQDYILTDAGDLAAFTGLGMTDFYVAAALATSSISAPNGLVAMTSSKGGAYLEVEYTYIVPEPGTLSVLALAAVGLWRRR